MILVVGEPRSGTSLVMQTLAILGLIPLGLKFPAGRNPGDNSRGFWEHEEYANNQPILLSQDDNDQCAKVFLRRFLDNPRRLSAGNKIIGCFRPAAECAQAQANKGIIEADKVSRVTGKIQERYQRLSTLTTNNPQVPYLQVNINTFRNNPTATVDAIIAFVGPLPERGRTAAIANVSGGGE
jgi:hypothetical protein